MSGYWNRPELSRETFEVTIANDHTGIAISARETWGFLPRGRALRLRRVKDLIIVRGVTLLSSRYRGDRRAASFRGSEGDRDRLLRRRDGEARVVVVAE